MSRLGPNFKVCIQIHTGNNFFFLLPLIITDNRLFVLSKSIVSCMETSVMTTVYTDYSQRILTVFICFIVSKLMTWQCTVCRTSVYLCIVYHIHSKFIKLFNGSWKSSLFVTVSWSGPKNDQAKSTQLWCLLQIS